MNYRISSINLEFVRFDVCESQFVDLNGEFKMKQVIFNRFVKPRLGHKQKGASSLEYIALAAIVIAILLAVSTTDISSTIATELNALFGEASDGPSSGG